MKYRILKNYIFQQITNQQNYIQQNIKMQRQQRFNPDIQVKYHQIVAHMNEKNKVIQQFSRVLKELCDWEMFNSKNLDKFANSISKLLIGKDPLKQTFILFERILASKADQANKMAVSIKQDMLPFLQNAINLKDQTVIKNQQTLAKQIKLNMNQKIRQLYSAEVNYKGICQKSKNFYLNTNNIQSRQHLQESKRIKRQMIDSEVYLTETINIYNHNIEDYMLNYTRLCEQLSQIQSNRKNVIKQSISKFIVFEMDSIKNVQYDLCRYAKIIQKMQQKLIIQDKTPFQSAETKTMQLAKIAPQNYILHLSERQQNQVLQTVSNKRLNQVKKFLDPSASCFQINKQSYSNIITDIHLLLTEAIEIYDIKTVKEVVHYANNYYMLSTVPKNHIQNQNFVFRRAKIPLIDAVLCHPIFKNQQFWSKYNSRLSDIIQKQLGRPKSPQRQSDEMKVSLSFLSGDIQFMKKLSGVQILQKILQKYIRYQTPSNETLIKSDNSLKIKPKSKNNQEQKQINQILQFQIMQNDYLYF